MSAFQQMAHDSQNLLTEPALCNFAGAVISPVNYSEAETLGHVTKLQRTSEFDFILDPQLYYPTSERGELRSWSYFPSDFDSAARDSVESWLSVTKDVVDVGVRLGVTHVCSPAPVPKVYNNEYFELLTQVGITLAEHADGRFTPMQSAIVAMADLAEANRALKVASILSATKCPWVYLVLTTDREPRRELLESDEVVGAMQLIHALENSGLRVLVAYSSSDVVLWKAAGATACATGKFFNVRRFTRSRFEPPREGGGVMDYWFEEALLASIRAGDLLRLHREGLLSQATLRNPYFDQVLAAITNGTPWRKLGWCQYLCWFADIDQRTSAEETDVKQMLLDADNNWRELDRREIYMEERSNDGTWVRKWLQAAADFRKSI